MPHARALRSRQFSPRCAGVFHAPAFCGDSIAPAAKRSVQSLLSISRLFSQGQRQVRGPPSSWAHFGTSNGKHRHGGCDHPSLRVYCDSHGCARCCAVLYDARAAETCLLCLSQWYCNSFCALTISRDHAKHQRGWPP
ncbi:hypothetical protein TRVL_08870 [Trypanosoma vivax]|nr:hypothetical protein TRVL_08870 [Trypanosoma vivax]